ncbi:uncharacterized protein [Ptychodera flava]|uniref:uncharacterized protein n=1 Tax=Ptychodera flava TaxID=63121 RepID=UPI00396AA35E
MKTYLFLLSFICAVSLQKAEETTSSTTRSSSIQLSVIRSKECSNFFGSNYSYKCTSSALCLYCPNNDFSSSLCQICNGKKECPGGEDEEGCPIRHKPYLNSVCAADFPYSCATIGATNVVQCLAETQLCDGLWQCSDGSDEIGCDYSIHYGDGNGRCPVPKQKRLGDVGVSRLNDQMLEAHNYFRCLHSSPKMTVSDKAMAAAATASKNSAAAGGLTHTYDGENLAWITNDIVDATGFGIVKLWYDEVAGYDYTNPNNSKGTTVNFSQVVWKASTQLGCAYAQDARGNYHIACEYVPAGNIDDQYSDNVVPPLE